MGEIVFDRIVITRRFKNRLSKERETRGMEVVVLGQIWPPAERSEAGGTPTTYRAPGAYNKEKKST